MYGQNGKISKINVGNVKKCTEIVRRVGLITWINELHEGEALARVSWESCMEQLTSQPLLLISSR